MRHILRLVPHPGRVGRLVVDDILPRDFHLVIHLIVHEQWRCSSHVVVIQGAMLMLCDVAEAGGAVDKIAQGDTNTDRCINAWDGFSNKSPRLKCFAATIAASIASVVFRALAVALSQLLRLSDDHRAADLELPLELFLKAFPRFSRCRGTADDGDNS